jgi:hypothetical protein
MFFSLKRLSNKDKGEKETQRHERQCNVEGRISNNPPPHTPPSETGLSNTAGSDSHLFPVRAAESSLMKH